MICRLRYRGFITFCGFMTLYIYYSIIQLSVDVYYEDPYLQVNKNFVRDTGVNSKVTRYNQTTANSTANVTNVKHIVNCTGSTEELSCSNISNIKIINSLGHGVTKEVFRGSYYGRKVAVKMVTSKVEDVKRCLQRKKYWKEQDCYLLANYKLLKEILFVQQLHHPNILKHIGYCVRNEKTTKQLHSHGVVSVTELGEEFKPTKYNRLTWEQRMTTVIELLDLIDYFEHSPLGSLMMTDMKTSQFLVVDNRVKVGDMDDVTNDEKDCQTANDCYVTNVNYGIKCVNNKCVGINTKFNLHFFNRKIFSTILGNGPSPSVVGEVKRVLDEIKNHNTTAIMTKESLQKILFKYQFSS